MKGRVVSQASPNSSKLYFARTYYIFCLQIDIEDISNPGKVSFVGCCYAESQLEFYQSPLLLLGFA